MIRALLRKTVRDARWLLLACAATLFAFSWIRVIIVATVETYRFQRIARNLPDFVKRLSPVPLDELINYPGLISFTYEEGLAYLIMALWTITRASDCVAGELSRGTLEMLLSQPISRLRYLLVHSAVTVAGIMLLATAAYAGTYTGIHTASVKAPRPTWQWRVPILGIDIGSADNGERAQRIPMTQYVEPRLFRTATVNYACLGCFLAGLTTALSSLDRYRWRTIGIVVGFYIVQLVFELTGMAIESCHWMLRWTFFSAYEPVAFTTRAVQDPDSAWRFLAKTSHGIVPDLGPLGYDSILLGLGLLGFVAAAIIFCRRDLPAPL
jgi:ABC-2 type transport system permease protein